MSQSHLRSLPRILGRLLCLLALGNVCLLGEVARAEPVNPESSVQEQLPVGGIPSETAGLIERLNRAEQEIATLKSQLDKSDEAPMEDPSLSPVDHAVPNVPTSDTWHAQLNALEQQFQEFKSSATKTKYPNVQVNGFFQADSLWFDQDDTSRLSVGDLQDGAGFRRTRLSAKGSVIENVNYMIQMDFGFFGRPTFTDVFMEVIHVPWLGNVRVGQWKQPFGLEVVTSVRYQTFMERSLNFQAWEPFRHVGTGFYNNSEDEMATWAASIYRAGNDQFGNDIGDNGGWAMAARSTRLLWYDDCDGSLDYLHVGGAYTRTDTSNDKFRFATIPEAFVGAFGSPVGAPVGTSKVVINSIANGTPPFVDTGSHDLNFYQVFGTEALWVRGPLSVQSEVQWNLVQQPGGGQLYFPGSYVFASYFLTGESRPYDKKMGALDRVKPLNNFLTHDGCWCGAGAWEVAGRWSYLDLNDGAITGGRLNDFTLGMNWYLNPYTKFQFNYIKALLANPVHGDSDTDIYGLRCQVDF